MLSYCLQANDRSFYLYCGKHFQNVNAWRLRKQAYVYESKIRNSKMLEKHGEQGQASSKCQITLQIWKSVVPLCWKFFYRFAWCWHWTPDAQALPLQSHPRSPSLDILLSYGLLSQALNALGPSTCWVFYLNGTVPLSDLACSQWRTEGVHSYPQDET